MSTMTYEGSPAVPVAPVSFISTWAAKAHAALSYVLAHPVVSFILLPVMICGAFAYRQEHMDRERMESTLKAQQVIFNQQAQAIKSADAKIADRDAVLAKTLDALAKVKNQPPASPAQTAAQIAEYLQLPSAPAVAASPAAGGAAEGLPVAGSVVFTPPQAEALRTASIGCAEDRVKLSACEQDALDQEAKAKALQDQEAALTKERDAAVMAVKGGSFFTRFKRNAKSVAIGVAVGIAISYAARH